MDKQLKEPVVRVFFALWPNDAERAALAAWQSPLEALCGGKAMRPETLHNTLVFIGNVAQPRLEALSLAAGEVRGMPFDLHLEEARYWGHNHIVYATPDRTPTALENLVGVLEARLQQHRFHFDRRDYQPHITLLRHATWREAALPSMPHVLWRVDRFVLVQSLSDARGARYEVLQQFPLAGA